MSLKKNDVIKLNIESCDLNGQGIGHYEGLVVFVAGAIKDEVILAHIIKVKKTYAIGKIEKVITASKDRIDPICPVYNKCGGCSFGHISYEAEAKIKSNHVKECFKRIGNLSPQFEEIITPQKTENYRNKAQFHVSMTDKGLAIGFYSMRSHRVIHCPACALQPAEFEKILEAFEEYIIDYKIAPYDEANHKGLLRHIYIRKAVVTSEIMVCPVINGKEMPAEDKLCEMLTSACPEIKSIVINTNTEKTNVIMGKECRTIYGSDYITDTLCSLDFRLSPLSFYQVNHDQAERLYNKAAEYAELTGNETVIDLYCGTGTIGLSMAHKAKEIIGVEIIPQAIEDAKINAKNNNIDNARFMCGDASQLAATLESEGIKPHVVILDPPRKGCARDVLETVARMSPDRVVYVSCDPATLARDCGVFKELGYETIKATPVDMFPRTGHVETVCLMSGINR